MVDVHCVQYIGERPEQQDKVQVVELDESSYLFVLADGMGGAVAGGKAASMALEHFRDCFLQTSGPLKSRLVEALTAANDAIAAYIEQHPEYDGMGTTLVATISDSRYLQWISVGDSPLWLIRNGEILQINEDHSMFSLLMKDVASKKITRQQALDSPEKNALLDAVMGYDIQYVDAPDHPIQLFSGDIIILASDGAQTCSLPEIVEIACTNANHTACDIAHQLIAAVKAHQHPGQDNTSLIVWKL